MPDFLRAIFLLLGLGVVAVCFWLRHMNARAQGWPCTQGTVLSSELEKDDDGETSVRIVYQYAIGARRFTSNRIGYMAFRNDGRAKAELLSRFSTGSEVLVYYDPRNPAASALLREPSSLWVWGVVTGIVFAAIGAFAP